MAGISGDSKRSIPVGAARELSKSGHTEQRDWKPGNHGGIYKPIIEETKMTELKKIAREYTPHALGVISGGLAVLCLWIAVALLSVPGAGLVAFAAASGALFWSCGFALAAFLWLDQKDEDEFARKREELRAQLRRTA